MNVKSIEMVEAQKRANSIKISAEKLEKLARELNNTTSFEKGRCNAKRACEILNEMRQVLFEAGNDIIWFS